MVEKENIEVILESKQVTQKVFTHEVEEIIIRNNGDVMDAILTICEKHTIDPQDAKKYMNKPLQYKFESYCSNLRLIPKGNQLPI